MEKEMFCNKCGNPLNFWDKQEDFLIKRNLGYGTKFDGDMLEIHLCCNCMNEFIESCKVSPVTEVEKCDYLHINS